MAGKAVRAAHAPLCYFPQYSFLREGERDREIDRERRGD